MIYLDNAATTCMFEGAADVYRKYACQSFFNPSASYREAINVAKELNEVRKRLLSKMGARVGNIIFTSGATESNNLAIMGSRRGGKCEYVFSIGEHPSVYNTAKELEKQGNIVHFVGLRKDGQVDYEMLESLLNEKTRLVSIMHVSNETGAINDIAKINALRNKNAPNALLHVDGVQAFCKIAVDLNKIGVDLYTISAHKFHGPKGVGCLYVKNTNSLKPGIFGGGQENGYRPGTENVAGIMAMDYSASKIDVVANYDKVVKLKQAMIEILMEDLCVEIDVEGFFSPFILSVGFGGVNAETLMRELQDEGVIVGMGSACSSKKAGNRILESMGKGIDEVKSRLRISFNAGLSREEVETAGKIILKTYRNLRERVK